MKMLVKFGYDQEYLFDISDLNILEKAIPVKKDGWGTDAPVYLDKNEMTFEMVTEDRIRFGEEDTKEKLKKDLEMREKQLSDTQAEKFTLQNENKALKENIEILEKLCPHVEKKEVD